MMNAPFRLLPASSHGRNDPFAISMIWRMSTAAAAMPAAVVSSLNGNCSSAIGPSSTDRMDDRVVHPDRPGRIAMPRCGPADVRSGQGRLEDAELGPLGDEPEDVVGPDERRRSLVGAAAMDRDIQPATLGLPAELEGHAGMRHGVVRGI